MLVPSGIYQRERERVETVNIGGGRMIDEMNKNVNTCVQKGNVCEMVHDTFGCYCIICGFVKTKF